MNERQKRLNEVYQYLRGVGKVHTQLELADAIGAKRPGISAAMNGNMSYLTDSLFKKISASFPGVFNLDYLINGNGRLLTFEEETANDVISIQKSTEGTKPRIPIRVSAGEIYQYYEGILEDQCERAPIVRQFPSYDFTMIVQGNSMEPKYEGGDEIACKLVNSVIQWGKAYVIDTKDGAFLKRVYDDGDRIRCVSYNTEYPDFYVEKSDIVHLYRIVGTLRVDL